MSLRTDLRRAILDGEGLILLEDDGSLRLELAPTPVWGEDMMKLRNGSGCIYLREASILRMGGGRVRVVGRMDGRPSGYLDFEDPEEAGA